MRFRLLRSCLVFGALCLLLVARPGAQEPSLVGWAMLPVDTYADGPTSGQFAGAGQFGHTLPLVDRQPVQGFSAVLPGPAPGTYYVMTDNGFGNKANSADALLRMYSVWPDFRTASGGSATVSAADFKTGASLAAFTPASYLSLSDPNRKLTFPLLADNETYPGVPAGIPVAPAIRRERLLTGGDIDIESVRRDRNGHFWFGDEFGPFLVETDGAGVVVDPEVPLAGVMAPENPHRGTAPANLGSSRGFEGLAIDGPGNMLYGLIEGTVTGDTDRVLRIHEFSVLARRFTGRTFGYQLEPLGSNIGDMTAVNDHQFLVLERNNGAGDAATPAPFKKVYLIDTAVLDANGLVRKTELVDLMRLSDPDDLNLDGRTLFTFPFVTIEDVLVVNETTLLVINDNNFPGGGGRGRFSDPTEFLLIRLAMRLR